MQALHRVGDAGVFNRDASYRADLKSEAFRSYAVDMHFLRLQRSNSRARVAGLAVWP
jgi:hypothetical protein